MGMLQNYPTERKRLFIGKTFLGTFIISGGSLYGIIPGVAVRNGMATINANFLHVFFLDKAMKCRIIKKMFFSSFLSSDMDTLERRITTD